MYSGTTGIQLGKARGAAKHPKMHAIASTTKSYLIQNVYSSRVGKP